MNIEEQIRNYLTSKLNEWAGDSEIPHQLEVRIMKIGAFMEFECRAYERHYGSTVGQTIQETINNLESSKDSAAKRKRQQAAELLDEAEKLEALQSSKNQPSLPLS